MHYHNGKMNAWIWKRLPRHYLRPSQTKLLSTWMKYNTESMKAQSSAQNNWKCFAYVRMRLKKKKGRSEPVRIWNKDWSGWQKLSTKRKVSWRKRCMEIWQTLYISLKYKKKNLHCDRKNVLRLNFQHSPGKGTRLVHIVDNGMLRLATLTICYSKVSLNVFLRCMAT